MTQPGIIVVIIICSLVVVWALTLGNYDSIEFSDDDDNDPARPTVNEDDALRRANESAALQDQLVATLGQLYGDIFTANDTEQRVGFLVEYLKEASRLRPRGHAEMEPPVFLSYDQARVKLIEGLNARYAELVVGAPDKIEDFDQLGLWLDWMGKLYNQFNLEEVDLDLCDIPDDWDDWLLKHYEAPTFEQFWVDPDAAKQDFVDIQLEAVTAIIDRDEFNVKFIRALCLANREVRMDVGEPALFELTKLTCDFNRARRLAMATA